MTTTGGKTWGAAHRLCDFLEAEWPKLELPKPCRILELGAGTGWLGMTLGRNLATLSTEGSICLTEQAEGGAIEWLEHNLEANRLAGIPLSAVRVAPLDWMDWANCSPCPSSSGADAGEDCIDLVIGSDLIYGEVGVQLLPKVLQSLISSNPGALVFYAHTLHRYDDFDIQFLKSVRAAGLDYRAVAAEGPGSEGAAPPGLDPLAEDAEGFLEELFPEQRVAIFQICLASDIAIAPFLSWSNCISDADV